ncbi:MAG: DUF502 domain-containing protein [Calditrichaeota bacterium]|nr:MAG: DUF502 domain-containing protein [Calditrichota bacterium]
MRTKFPSNSKKVSKRRSLYKSLRRIFMAGILVLIPVIMTFIAVKWLFVLVDGILKPYIELLFGIYIPGLGFIATVLLIFLSGLFATSYGGKRLINLGDQFLEHLPFIRRIYDASKDIVNAFTFTEAKVFKEVVLLEMPRKDLFFIGFVTSELIRKNVEGQDEMVTVFVPSVPMFTTGFLFVTRKDSVRFLDISIEEALELIVSGGMVSPETLPIKTV